MCPQRTLRQITRGGTNTHTASLTCTESCIQLASTVLATVDLLLGAGANVNVVAMGHSPLSLAILNGYDTASTRVYICLYSVPLIKKLLLVLLATQK